MQGLGRPAGIGRVQSGIAGPASGSGALACEVVSTCSAQQSAHLLILHSRSAVQGPSMLLWLQQPLWSPWSLLSSQTGSGFKRAGMDAALVRG